ncbi:MAG: sulfurtransferase [Hylemonella sp.]|nr:sulfurtransferase [Hylemonella sp.]
MYTTLITAAQLLELRHSAQPLMVFDCSFELMQPLEGDRQYERSHLAGAVRADLDRHLSCKDDADAVNGGRHPLPSRASFAAWLASVGFASDMQAVVYDRQGSSYCGRLWWMLKWVGHEAVAVLDGGLQAWEAAEGAIASGPDTARTAGSFAPGDEKARLVDSAEVLRQLGRAGQTLLDARAAPRFRGEVEPLDPVAGHIPGALNRPFALNFDADGRFKPATQLRAEFMALLDGRDPADVVHQCGSGVSAVPNLLAMEIAGLGRSGLYAGSWSEWCSDPSRPMAQG